MTAAKTCASSSCDNPIRDGVVCKACRGKVERALSEVPWLVSELGIVLSRQTRYGARNGARSTSIPLPVDLAASKTLGDLTGILDAWCDVFASLAPNAVPMPPLNSPHTAAAWLGRRDVEAVVMRSDQAGDYVDAIKRTRRAVEYAIDRPIALQYLGLCVDDETGCPGRLYAKPGEAFAECDTCRRKTDAETRRAALVAELDSRLCTAAEIARLSTYLGLDADRERVRLRVGQWHSRKRIVPDGHAADGGPLFRFGLVWRLLAQDDLTKGRKTA